MASCKKCKKPVGCGCNLKNGLCASCNKEATVKVEVPVPVQLNTHEK